MKNHRTDLVRVSDISRDERGVALAIVLLVGVALVLVSTVVVSRGFRQLVNTSNDTNWDNALLAAETGLDSGLVTLDGDFSYATGETIPLSSLGTDAERIWAVAAADARAVTGVIDVPEGQYVLVRPDNANVVFAVGYSPSRTATARRVRVVRATIEGNPYLFTLEFALLVGDDLELSGNTTINDTNSNDGASVHANGTVSEIGGSATVEGCLTESDSTRSATSTCPPSPLPPEPMPVIDPLLLYPYSHYVLCDDGVAYGGPVHPTNVDLDLIPCNGNETAVSLGGWDSRMQGGVMNWSTLPEAATDGVFYIQNGNFDGKLGSSGDPRQITIVLESGGGGSCSPPSTGNLELGGNSDFSVHPSMTALGWDIAAVAQGDIDFAGGSTVGGALLAHEQMDYIGNADSWGAVVAVEACDTLGSPLTSSSLSGTSVINYPGPFSTPFTASNLQVDVVGWYEL
jgi:hypothetical protein